MKLIEIYKQLLKEIGESGSVPPDAKFKHTEYSGSVDFKFLGNKYTILIRFPVKQGNVAVMAFDFETKESEHGMTNKHQALKVMSYVVGCIEEWIKQYKQKFMKGEDLQISYIKYNPKSEEGEVATEDGVNARDRVYRLYIEKFAKKYGSSTTFSSSGGIVASFSPKLTI